MKNMINYIKNNRNKSIIIAVFVLVSLVWLVWSNISIEISRYTVCDELIPSTFDGFKIAQVSDLHNAEFGQNNAQLLNILDNANPDIIVITGDTIDYFHTNTEVALNFIERAMKIAPCYYITGNHEGWLGRIAFSDFEDKMIAFGVVVLHDESVFLEKEEEKIVLMGIDDPDYSYGFSKTLSKMETKEHFTILLSHRPEYFDEYVSCGYDLVLSGHAHGGQFRLPLIGGILAPDQGWFPKYDSGMYIQENTTMIVSRGLGNSVVPIGLTTLPNL